ncbi:MAG TPA: quinolinate synthase NadA [Syntrophales bacterium]|jgi:quinolinate synthase|nr:quinolinate synthase NadA [Syntrophales bacterium]HPX55104.1 quinolinate synthase NadA [Syntrophales bacterium]HQA82243.1 quinolinate synthase NadA [Syntrophales bacterium]
MNLSPLQKEIVSLLREKKAILLVHYYQRREIQEIADFLGDSLALCMAAAKTDAEIIVFAGVHFMAESAAILCPGKTVLIPRPDAGCPLADTITPEQLRKAREDHPGATVVTYINSTADIKALSDICCTSANALAVIASIRDAKEILMVPDGNLARYTARFTDSTILPWNGACPVHQALTPEEVRRRKAEYHDALFIAHPECSPEVLDLADFVGSTAAMLKFVRESDRRSFIVGTEAGILVQMEKENPGKILIPAAEHLICETMKYTTLEDIHAVLKDRKHIVTVDEEKRLCALSCLKKMMALSEASAQPR